MAAPEDTITVPVLGLLPLEGSTPTASAPPGPVVTILVPAPDTTRVPVPPEPLPEPPTLIPARAVTAGAWISTRAPPLTFIWPAPSSPTAIPRVFVVEDASPVRFARVTAPVTFTLHALFVLRVILDEYLSSHVHPGRI